MTEIFRAQNRDVIRHIESKLVFSDRDLKVPFIIELAERLDNRPDSVRVFVAAENEEVIGYIIAQDPGLMSPHIYVAQAWSQPGNAHEIIDSLMDRVVLWAIALEKKMLRAETSRPDAIFRRLHFRPISSVVQLDLDEYSVLVEHPDG